MKDQCKSSHLTNGCVLENGHKGRHRASFGMEWNQKLLRVKRLTPPPPCGCKYKLTPKGLTHVWAIVYCPLHANAPALRDALGGSR